jgi:hypothetical protein
VTKICVKYLIQYGIWIRIRNYFFGKEPKIQQYYYKNLQMDS